MMMGFFNKIISLYQTLAKPAKASLWFVFCSVIQKSMYFLMIPIYTHLLTTEEYGIYSVYASWVALIAVFAGLNLAGNSYNVGMTKYDRDRDRYTSSITGLWWFHTALWFVAAFLLRNLWTAYTGLSVFILACVFCHIYGEGGFDIWMAKRRFDLNYKQMAIVVCAFVLSNILAGVGIVLLFHDKASAAVGAKAGVMFVFGILGGFLNWKKGGTLFHFPYWREALLFNIPLIAYYLSLTILAHSDRLMIHAISGADKAGIYGIAYSLATVLTFLTGAVNNAFTPWEFKHLKTGDVRPVGNVAAVFLMLIGLINLLLIAVAPEIIYLFTTPDYYEAIWVIPPVAFSAFLMCLYQLFVNVEFYYEKKYFIMIASISVAVLNVVLNALMIPVFGYIAAAYTTLVSYICFATAHYIFMEKVRRSMEVTQPIYHIRQLLIISAVIFILAAGFLALYERPLLRYGFLAFLLILAGIGIISGRYQKIYQALFSEKES